MNSTTIEAVAAAPASAVSPGTTIQVFLSPQGPPPVALIQDAYHVRWKWFYWHVCFGFLPDSIEKFLSRAKAQKYASDLNAAFTAGRNNKPPVIAPLTKTKVPTPKKET